MPILDTRKVRMPAVAGQFYEANPLTLRRSLMEAEASFPGRTENTAAKMVILPHAGYMFSMPAALRTLREAAGGNFKRAVILAPSHRVALTGAALTECDVLRTPFGDLPADRRGAERLCKEAPGDFVFREDAHRTEHAVEVQLPLLQYYFKDLTVLPVVLGSLDWKSVCRIAGALAQGSDEETLWAVSSDFTHYGRDFGYVPFEEDVPEKLPALDLEAAEWICKRDSAGFTEFLKRTGATVCGAVPILTGLETARILFGENLSGKLVVYSNSGHVTGDWRHAVGYAGIAFR